MGLNRIYKVVWNKTKGCYVVVSELAKRVGRNKAKAIVISSAAMAMAVSPMMADAAPAGNAVGEGHANAVAFGPDSNASQDGAVALGKQSKATGTEGAALGKGAKAEGNLSVAVGSMSQATADSTMALGVESKASKSKAVALGRKAEATEESAMALGFNSKAQAGSAVALGEAANANQARAVAIGKGATISSGQDTIAIGTDTNAKGHTSIVIGKNAKTTNDAEGTVVIGRDAFSEGSGNGGRPNTVVGRGAYTAFGENGTYRLNAATALGFGAGAGLRTDPGNGNKLVNNETNADNNADVLVKAGYGLDENAPADTKTALQGGKVDKNLTFYRKKHINEATALGAEARAIGDQSIAIGGQVIAGDGVVALGGNDTDQLRNNKYQVVTNDAVNSTNVNTIDDYNLAYTESTRTVAGQYKNLVGRDMPTAYKSTYGQSGSVVIGMEAHSTTALGTAIGTNSVVRMGAFGATAIGAGSTVQPNAEAAVAIGMGSVANGAYALAGGTASWADYGDIALGYQAKATGKDGAIAMGRATNAQGDSSIMIGGANIGSAAAQSTSFEKSNNTVTKKTVTEKINGKNVNREYTFAGTTKTNDTVAAAYKELTGRDMETNALNFADNKYKNGHASTSLGVHALSRGDLGTAIGAGSRADSIGSVALGVGARANRQNAVAIGTGSTTDLVGTRQLSVSYDKDGNVVDDNSPNKAYTFNWAGGTNTSEGDVVSFGSSGAERQLKNVAAGRVADDSTDAINGSQLNSVSKKLATGWNIAGDSKTKVAGIGTDDQVNFVNGNGTTVTVTKQEEVKNGTTVTTAKGANVKFDVKAADGSITSDANGISVNTDGDTIGKTTDGKLKANTGTINTGDDGKAAPNTGDGNKLATVDTVVNAVNNAAWKATAGNDGSGTETGKSEEKIKAGDVVTFKAGDNLAIKQAGKNFIYSLKPELTGLTSAGFKNAAGDTTVIDGNGMTITPKDAPAKPVSLTKDGLDNGGKTIKNVTSGLTNYPTGTPKAGLVDLSKPATGTPVPDTTAATVGDLRNMGWVVSSDKTTGELTKAYTDQVKNADEVKFVGEGGVTVSGKTENGVRTITVKAEAQEMPEQPVSYTTADGTKVYPKTVTKPDGTKEVKYYSEPNGKGTEILKENVIASINGPEGTKAPTTLSNVAGNLDGAKKDTKAPSTEHAPVNTTDVAAPNYVNPNNAATVGDVLNAGWNLQNNGTAKDFVKPYDTVNFVNGANTTAVVTTSADGTTSNVTYNVTGLPVTYTDAEGNPVAKVGDKYYKVNNQGQPVDADGNPSTKVNDKGQPLDAKGNVIDPVDTTKPLKTALVNPTPAGDKPNTTSPTQLGNVANGANTFEPVDGKKMANDGKWYNAADVLPNGQPKENVQPVAKPDNVGKAGLIDFSNSNPNNAATVGDLQNLGWIVSAEGNKYSDQVRNANEVKFVGEGTASVTGKTDENGVRTITVKVDDQVSTNNAQTPVNYTNKDGKKVYPVKDENGNVTYHTTPDGKGKGDETVPAGDVITSLNGPEGTTTPTTLNNVKNNIPAVNDADKKVTNPDGTEKGTAGDVNNINKAPLTATEAADLLKPTKDGKPNPNFAGNNAATVSDVLNAGWNLQNNGTAKDFVKPFDTVNFVDGANTTAVVTTNTDGTTSNVTYNVTGLPVTFTDKAGKPVSKIGDKYYPVNEKGQPVSEKGNPAVGTNNDGDLVDKDGNVIKPIDTAKDPLKSNMVNPNVENTKEKPNNQTTSPTQLGNVANGAETFKPADDVKLANDGKWYNAADVKPNGAPKTAEENNGIKPAPVASPLVAKNAAGDVLEKGNDGNWYKSSDLEKGEPKPNAKQQSPEPKPKNADKAGLINFENSNPNNAATVGDLQNMGFVVSAKDNGYTEQMRNANKVEFKGDNGVQVTGKTLADGTREITVALKEGRVTNDVLITDKDGKVTHGVRGEDGKIYTKDPKTGKATNEEIPVTPSDTVENDGNAYVTGNSVATAIQKSGWNIGIGSTDKAFSEEAKTYERVNPKDNVKYVNGANTTVSMAVDAAEDKDGATVTTTYVKVDVNRDLHIDRVTTGGPAKDKAGNPLKPVNGEYYPENALVNDGKVYPAGTVMIDGKPYPAGSAKDPKTKTVLKDGKPAPEAQPLTATPKDQLADGKDGAMTVKDAKGNDGVSATAKDGKGTLTLKDVGKDGKDASQVDISTAKAPADLENTPKDAVRANDGNWYAPADVTVEVKDGKTVVTPKAGKTPIPNAPTMDRIQYTDGKGTSYNVATMNDGLRFVGDDGETISKPLNSTMEFTGGNREDTGKPVAKAATTTGNIGVFHDKGKLSIQLAKDLEKLNSANFESKTDKAGNPLKVVDGKYYPEKAVVKEGKVYPEGTVIIDNKPYPAGTTKDAAGNVVHNGKPATEATPINPIDSKQVQDGPTSRLTGTGLTFNTPTPKDENGNPLVLVDGKYYKADNLENGKPKADAKAEPVKPAQSTAFTPDGLVVTPETAKVRDANGNPVLDKDGREVVDPTKVVSFGSPTIAVDPKTGKPMVDPKTGEPVMKSGISAGGQVMANVAPGVLDTDAVNVSQLKGVSNMVMNVNNRVNRLGAQAAAMAGLRHLQYDPLEPTTIMAGVGAYKGEAALALGIAHYKNESTLFHAGASIGSRGDELMANAGVSWKFGARADETAVKDTFRQGPISSSYTLQDKVSALEAQNQVQKDEINNLKAQLAEVLQYVKKG